MASPNNLPQQLTSFIGREHAISEVTRLLAGARLLTLNGIGGCGKTRLSLQVATNLLESYPDGVYFVDLAPLIDPSLLPQAITSALRISEQSGHSHTTLLANYLASRKLLLVLDNCEHLLRACTTLAGPLLASCPDLRILTTSREAFNVAGEILYRVPALSMPDPDRLPPFDALLQYEAIQLFVERARFKRPGFALTPQNAPHAAQLCHHLDGMPLAIELAAARTAVLSIEQIVDRVGERFRLLRDGNRTALPRHQTLMAAIDWSYDLLTPVEQTLLRGLSVFARGFSLEAVAGICDLEIDEYEIIDLLAHLVDKSLLLMEERDGQARYRLLETIRQYAWQKATSQDELTSLRTRLLHWHIRLTEQAKPELQGPDQKVWLDRLAIEYDNIRASLAWSQITPGEAEPGLRLAEALARFWYVRGYLSEGRKWLETALAASGTSPMPLRAKALYGTGVLIRNQGDYPRAASVFGESLVLFRQLDDKLNIAAVLINLAVMAGDQGDYVQATALLTECMSLQQELGDKQGLANSLNNLGNIATAQGDYKPARSHYEQSLALFRELGNIRHMAISLNNLGYVARNQGDYEVAQQLIEESLGIKRELGDKIGIASSLSYLGEVEWCRRQYDRAHELYWESLSIFRDLSDKEGIAYVLNDLGELARCKGNYGEALVLYEEALTLSRDCGANAVTVTILHNLARIRLQQGEYEQAEGLFLDSLCMSEQLQAKVDIAECFFGLAKLVEVCGLLEQSGMLLAAVEAIFEVTGYKQHPSDHDELLAHHARLRKGLSKPAWQAAMSEGRQISLEQAIALVFPVMPTHTYPKKAHRDAAPIPAYPNDLTRREVDVLRLLAEGLTNEQIAERLFLSSNTVRAHLHSIFGKLNVTTRASAVRFAIEHNLT